MLVGLDLHPWDSGATLIQGRASLLSWTSLDIFSQTYQEFCLLGDSKSNECDSKLLLPEKRMELRM